MVLNSFVVAAVMAIAHCAPSIDSDGRDEEPVTPMSPPIRLKAQVISSHTVVLTWSDITLGMDQKITDNRYYRIRYTPSQDHSEYKYINSTDLVKQIDNLTPDTMYEFSVQVLKGQRKSTWSMAANNRTQEAAPGSTPRELTPIPVEGYPLSVTLTWQPPQKPNGQINGYLVFYTTDPTKDDRDWVVEGVLGEDLSLTITDLKPNTTYYFKVQARNSKGYGPMSPTERYKTPMNEEIVKPMFSPIGLKALVLSSHTVVLTWSDVTLEMDQKITDNRYYRIRYTPIQDHSEYKYVNSAQLLTQIDNLTPDTMYEFSVQVLKGQRKSTWSMAANNRTQEAAPGSAPRDLTPVAVEGDPLSVTLTWQPPLKPNGQITGYLVFYTTDPTKDDIDWVVEGVLGEKLSMTITDLKPNTTYYFKVQARNSKGYGPMSPTDLFKTPMRANLSADILDVSENTFEFFDYFDQLTRNHTVSAGSEFDFFEYHDSQSPAPKIKLAPKNMRVAEDLIVSFFCKASGYPPPDFHWERKGQPIHTYRRRYDVFPMSHGTVLRLQPVKAKKDNTYFTCVAKNEHGEARANATLHIYDEEGYPRITKNPMLKSVEKNKTATFECSAHAENRDPPSIYWLKDNLPLEAGDPRIHVDDDGTLTIERTQTTDGGKYECVAENEIGVAYSYAAMLYVKVRRVPPRFSTELPDVMAVQPNGDITIDCVAKGSPMPIVIWRRGNQEINPSEAHYGRNILSLTSVRESANYTCVAQSELGAIEKDVYVQVKVTAMNGQMKNDKTGKQAPGSAPRNVQARPQSLQTIRIDWDEPEISNGNIQGYKVFYTTNPYLPIVLWESQSVEGDSKMTTVSGLNLNGTYSICVLAFNSMGQGPLSLPVQVMTRQRGIPVPLQPRNLVAKTVSSNEIEITWDAPEDVDKVLHYSLLYQDYQTHLNGQINIALPTTKYRLTDLIPDTVYHIQLAAWSKGGEEVKSDLVQAKTLSFIPGEPRRVQVHALNSTAIYVEWRPPQARDQDGIIRGYYAYIAQLDENTDEPIIGTEKVEDTNDGNKNDIVISGLQPATKYQVTVAGYTRRGDGVRSRVKCVITLAQVPSSPRELLTKLIQLEPPIAQISWWKPESTNGQIIGYKLYWGPKNQVYEQLVFKENVQSWRTPPLDRGVLYEFRVLAKNEDGYGKTAVAELFTPDPAPPPPEDVQVVRTSPTTILVKWQEPERNNSITSYRIFYSWFAVEDMSIWNQLEIEGPATTALLTDLDQHSSYAIRLQSMSINGRWSNMTKVIITDLLLPDAPGSAPRNVQARPESRQTIRIDWDEPEIPNGNIQGYKVFYTTNPELPIVLWEVKSVEGDNKMTTVSGLIPNSTYTISVLAFSSIGQGPLSEPVQVITRQRVPLQPKNLVAKAMSPNEIEITWDAPEDVDKILNYLLMYQDKRTHLNGQINIALPTTKYRLTNLIPDTVYHMQLAALSKGGEEAKSDLVQAKTLSFIPDEPRRVEVQAVNATTIHVEWRQPRARDQDGVIRGYYVYIAQLDDNTDEPIIGTEKVEDTNNGNKNDIVITGLQPDTKYQVTVAGYTQRGDGVRSREKIITTLRGVPSSPTKLLTVLDQQEPPIAHISWSKPDSTYGQIKGYKLYWGPKNQVYERLDFTENENFWITPPLDRDVLYEFHVLAKNELGFGKTAVAELLTPGRPSIPSSPRNVTVKECSNLSAVISWAGSPDTSTGLTRYIVEYNTSFTPNVWKKAAVVSDSSVTEVKIALSPYANYTFRVMAENYIGRSEPSRHALLMCATDMDVPHKNPSNVHTDTSSTGFLIVKWDKMPEIEHNGEGFRYIVHVKGSDGRSLKSVITDWRTNTWKWYTTDVYRPYEIVVEASNALGYCVDPPLVLTGYSGEAEPKVVPSNLELVSVRSSAAVFQWDPVDTSAEAMQGKFQGYKIRLWKAGERNTTEQVTTVPGKLFSYTEGVDNMKERKTVYSLPLGPDLEAEVQASNTHFDSQASNIVAFTRPLEAPGSAPRNVQARPESRQTIRIDWDEPEIPNGNIQGYKVFYTTNPELPIVLWEVKSVEGDNKMTTVSGLIPNSTYTISVLAFSSIGQGPLSEPVQVITRQRVPLQPKNLVAKAVSPNEIEITWDAPEDVDKILNYLLMYQDKRTHLNGQINIALPTTKYRLTNLIPDTVYHMQLAALSKGGEEAKSDLVQAKTLSFIPDEPRRVEVQAVNATTIHVEWRQPRARVQDGVIRGYYVYIAQLDDNTDEPIKGTEKVEDTNNGNKNDIVITGLQSDTKYQVTVAGYTQRGDGVRSREKIITTLRGVPSSPTKLLTVLDQQEPPIAHISWSKPDSTYGQIKGYKLYWGPKNQVYERLDFTENENFWITPPLDRDVLYEFHVLAKNDIGFGKTAVAELLTPGRPSIPSQPRNVTVKECSNLSAVISWAGSPDTSTDVTRYFVEYNTSFTPNVWKRAAVVHDSSVTEVKIALSPYANYTFRVIAENYIGRSEPSRHTLLMCATEMDVPHKNPSNVHTDTSSTGFLIVKWDTMPEIEHNGEGFRYIVHVESSDGRSLQSIITDWRTNTWKWYTNDVYTPYEIVVEAINALGYCVDPPLVLTGYSGEAEPKVVPSNFELVSVSFSAAVFQWDPVDTTTEAMQGKFQGYKIRLWKAGERNTTEQVTMIEGKHFSYGEGVDNMKERATVDNLPLGPYLEAEVQASNTHFDSQASNIVAFTRPTTAEVEEDRGKFIIRESQRLYKSLTLPFIKSEKQNLQWVYDILEKKSKQDKIIFEDPDPEIGFVLLPVSERNMTSKNDLNLVAIVHKHGIRSLRDLDSSTLSLLENILKKGQQFILETFGIPPSKLSIYVRYQPSYYHFHVYFKHITHEDPGFRADSAHLLTNIIDNIKLRSRYYRKKTLSFVVGALDDLFLRHKEAGYFED